MSAASRRALVADLALLSRLVSLPGEGAAALSFIHDMAAKVARGGSYAASTAASALVGLEGGFDLH